MRNRVSRQTEALHLWRRALLLFPAFSAKHGVKPLPDAMGKHLAQLFDLGLAHAAGGDDEGLLPVRVDQEDIGQFKCRRDVAASRNICRHAARTGGRIDQILGVAVWVFQNITRLR